MSEKPCSCNQMQPQAEQFADTTPKPEIVPLPPEIEERNRAERESYQEQLPDYLVKTLVTVPEDAPSTD